MLLPRKIKKPRTDMVSEDFSNQAVKIDCQVEGCPNPAQACRISQISKLLIHETGITYEASLRRIDGCPMEACGTEVAQKSFPHSVTAEMLQTLCQDGVVVDIRE